MKKYFLLLFAISVRYLSIAQTDTLLHNYNSTFYPSVLAAAKGIAMPFLIQQKYLTMTGVSVADTELIYKGIHYNVYEEYLNPAPEYYISKSLYSTYGISDFSAIWPTQIPNILFKASDTTFNGVSDCVGYLTRLLSATGNTSTDSNAYLNIINTTHAANRVHFAAIGYVSTAYSFGVAFPTFPTVINYGWEYIAGNVEVDSINTYNHTIQNTLGSYNGIRKGGFAASLPGDVLAFGYSASSSSNGHVMVMETTPHILNADSLIHYFPSQTLAQATALLNTHTIYSVPVFDCSSGIKVHFQDSRTQMSGIGHGKLLILTDKTDDAPTGFIFDTLEVTGSTITIDTLGSSVYAISVGRFVVGSVTTQINGISNNDNVLAYPNPSNGNVQVVCSLSEGDYILSLENVIGQTILTQNVHISGAFSTTLNISGYGAGIYLLGIKGENIKVVKKLVVY